MDKIDITIVITVTKDRLDEVHKDCEQWMNKMHEVYGVDIDSCIGPHEEDDNV